MNVKPIIELPFDSSKRYLIIGDIHGRYNALMEVLSKANYDSSKDIVITVGDMIDRGPNSIEVLRFFTNSADKNSYNTLSVMGNHEAMMLEDSTQDIWIANGGPATINSARENNVTFDELRGYVRMLPYVISIGNYDVDPVTAFRVIHAEFPLLPEPTLISSIKAAKDSSSAVLQTCIWSRSNIDMYHNYFRYNESSMHYRMLENRVEWIAAHQPMRTYMGHTPVKDIPTRIANNFYIDTGMGKLTMIDAHTGEYWSSNLI